MGKKAKTGKSTINFEEIEQYIEAGNYRQAIRFMRKAKVGSPDKRKLDQFQIDAHYLWALDYFKQKEYTQTISTIRMFIERYKKKIDLPLEKANLLIGISYLYNNNWEKAVEYLQITKNNNLPASFSFYYLLAILYKRQYTQYSDFLSEYEKEVNSLEDNREKYLEVVFSLVQREFSKARKLLDGVDGTTEEESKNLLALKSILENGEWQEKKKSLNLKGLYKYIMNIPLPANEETYLFGLPHFKEISLARKHTKIRTQLASAVKQLCEEGKPLSASVFEDCTSLPKEYLPYIVYNQVAALFNQDIEDNELEIEDILKKYEWHFFKVPEAPFLFAQIVFWNEELFTANFFWKNIEVSLDRFGKSYSKLQLNRLSWRIYSCLRYSDYSDREAGGNRYLGKLIKTYPSMLGLKLWCLFDYVFLPNETTFSDHAIDLFTFREFQYGGEFSAEYLENGLKDSLSVTEQAQQRFGDFIQKPIIQAKLNEMDHGIITKLFVVIKKTTIEQEVHLKNKVVLDYYRIAHKYFTLYKRKNVSLKKEEIQAFTDGYKKQLDLFEEATDSDFYLDYKELLEGLY